MIAGAPSVVLAIFGLLMFSRPFLAFLSQTSAGGSVFGRSFFTAGAMMSLLALPLVVGATREGLAQVPGHVREASYALGKAKITTIRKVLLPSVRRNIAGGVTLGLGRIIGDTAIVVILLGATLHLEGAGGAPGLSTLRGTGGTLTSYVKYFSPAGEGNQARKGLRGGVRAAADGDRAERARDAHHARAPRDVRADDGLVVAAVLETGTSEDVR